MRPESTKCWCSKTIQQRLQHYRPLLEQLQKATPRKRARIIEGSNSCFVRLMSEIGLNVLKGNIQLEEGQYHKLRAHKQLLLDVSHKKSSLKERKRRLVEKKGGFLPLVIPAVLSAISSFAGQALSRVISDL